MNWRSNSNRLLPSSPVIKTTPVTLPPGRAKLVTRPSLTGSLPVVKTIGIVAVAAMARNVARVLPTITAAGRLTKPVTSAGSRSNWFSAQRNSIATFCPSTKPASVRPARKAAMFLTFAPQVPLLT
jgi:hypothetical protein